MNLYIIGYRGSGKSTVAPLIACQLDWRFADSDDAVEAQANLTIAEIFAKQGEPGFRQLEMEAIAALARQTQHVVSLGGGAPLFPDNRKAIERSGKTVWLKADVPLLWQRISNDQTTSDRRPALTEHDGRSEVQTLLTQRSPVYEACADYTIEIDSLTPQEIADRIVNWFETVDK